jgi:UDP-N-acetylmuramate--alanine ligase
MDFNKIDNVYFVGIGGIGMSALARYFNAKGKLVAGYDRTPSFLTDQLSKEGIDIHFADNVMLMPQPVFSDKEHTLVVYTPAIPASNYELNFFKERKYTMLKRSEVLGLIFSNFKGVAVAGTHGKTTTSTMIAHLLHQSTLGCNAFLGGISKNYGTNLILSDKSEIVVAEADEFDRSFLRLFPYIAVVTSVDADHLDIYGTHEEVKKSFNQFIQQINSSGVLIYKKGISLSLENIKAQTVYTYSATEKADFCPLNIRLENGLYTYDLQTPKEILKDIKLGVSGGMNLENSIAACAVAYLLNVKYEEIKTAFSAFTGVKRRFEFHINTPEFTYIDDYAHHPEELKACITAARNVFPGKKLTGIFQPHLFTRTRDFCDGFAESLSLLDELILLEIYPAREEPIPGISSDIIFKQVKIKNKVLIQKQELMEELKKRKPEVLITMGAGDIDRFIEPIKGLFG